MSFFDFSGDSEWLGSLENLDDGGGLDGGLEEGPVDGGLEALEDPSEASSSAAASRSTKEPAANNSLGGGFLLDTFTFEDDDEFFDDDDDELGGSAIDDQWSQLTDMYLNLTLDSPVVEEKAEKPEQTQASPKIPQTPPKAVPKKKSGTLASPALPSIPFSSPGKMAGFASSPSKTSAPPGFQDARDPRSLWDQPSPAIWQKPEDQVPPSDDAAASDAVAQMFQQQGTSTQSSQSSQQQQQSAQAAGQALLQQIMGNSSTTASNSSKAKPMSLADLEAQMVSSKELASKGSDSGMTSLEAIEAQIRASAKEEGEEPVQAEESEESSDSEESEEEEVVVHRKPSVPNYSRIKADKTMMSARDLNYVLKMQRFQLLNTENIYEDDFYNQSYLRKQEAQEGANRRHSRRRQDSEDAAAASDDSNATSSRRGVTGERKHRGIPIPNHTPICDKPDLPLPPHGPSDFSGVLGKIPPGSLRCPRELLQLIDASDADTAQEQENKPADTNVAAASSSQAAPIPTCQPPRSKLFDRYATLLRLEKICMLVVEIEDLDVVIQATPASRTLRIKGLRKRRSLRSKQLYPLLEVYHPMGATVAPFAFAGCKFCYPRDVAFFQLLETAKGRKIAARALTVLEAERSFVILMLLLRNFPYLLQIAQPEEPSMTMLWHRVYAKVLTFPIQYASSILHTLLYFHRAPELFVSTLQHPAGAGLFSTILKRIQTIRSREQRNPSGHHLTHPLHWQACSKIFSSLYHVVLQQLTSLCPDDLASNTHRWTHLWEFFTSLAVVASPSQKRELAPLLTDHLKLDSSNPWTIARSLIQALKY